MIPLYHRFLLKFVDICLDLWFNILGFEFAFVKEMKLVQYLVNTSGEVLNRQARAYAIKAHSEEEALEIAKHNFCEEYYSVDENISVLPYRRTYKAIAAYFFMLIPIALSFINWKIGHDTKSIMPNYISCLYAILIYSAFVIKFKGIHRTISSWIDIAFCIFNVLILSSFIQTILVTKTINFFWIKQITISTNMILPFVIILSWFGLKIVSVGCMGLVGVFALFNITELSEAMGPIWGTAYVLCAFIGILFYISIEPAFTEVLPHIKKSVRSGLNYVRNDMVEAGNTAKFIETKH